MNLLVILILGTIAFYNAVADMMREEVSIKYHYFREFNYNKGTIMGHI